MIDTSGKKAALKFRKKFKVLKPTLDGIKKALRALGYDLVEFNAIYNDENVSVILDKLELNPLVETQKGFTYTDADYRLVFLHEDLSDEEKRVVLLHEVGHIFCGHMQEKTYIGRDVQQEAEANGFAYCLLNPGAKDAIAHFFRGKWQWVVLGVFVLSLVVGACWFAYRENLFYGDFYVTTSGNRYHRKECIHIKNKTNVHRLTTEQFETEEYGPCGICLPNE